MEQEINLKAQYQGNELDIYLDSQALTAKLQDQIIPTNRLSGFQDFKECRKIAALENCWFKLIDSKSGLILVKSPCFREGVQFGALSDEQTEYAIKETLTGKSSIDISSVLSLEHTLIDNALADWQNHLKVRKASEPKTCNCGLRTPEIVCICENKFTALCSVCCEAHISQSSLSIHPFEPIEILDHYENKESKGILKFLIRKERIEHLKFAVIRIIHRIDLFKIQVQITRLPHEKKSELYTKADFIKSKYEKLVQEFNDIGYYKKSLLSSNAKELLISIKRKSPEIVTKELEISLRLRSHSGPSMISPELSASITYNLSDFTKTIYTIDTSGNLWEFDAYNLLKRSHILPDEFKEYTTSPGVCTLPSEFAFFSGGQKQDVSTSCGIVRVGKNTVQKLNDMNVPRFDHCLVYFEGDIYAFGGNNGNSILKSVEAYSLKDGVWRTVCDMPNPRSKFAACIIDDKIWLAGGIGTTEIDIFDTTRQTYSRLNNPVPLHDGSTLISNLGDKYIIIQSGVVQYYYPEAEISEPVGSITDTSAVLSNRVFVHSGRLFWVNHENQVQVLRLNGPMELSLSSL